MAETYVDIMIQSLKKKAQVLDQIIEVNKTQKAILEDPGASPDAFDQTVDQKSALIEQIDQLDSGFEKLFAKMKEELESNKAAYADQIRKMQDLIRRITDKSVEVQAQEARNKDLMVQKFTTIKRQAKSVRKSSAVVSKYYQTMSKLNYVDPQFMDNKH